MDRTNTVIAFVCQSEKRKKLIASIQKKHPSIRFIPIICIGKMNPAVVFRLLLKETRGVILIGCEPSDCHYREGAFFAERRFYLLKETLKGFGLDENLLHIIWSNPKKHLRVIKSVDSFMDYLQKSVLEKGGNHS